VNTQAEKLAVGDVAVAGTARLSDPLTLPGGQVLANRFMKAALSEALADRENNPSPGLVNLYRRWGRGGYGLIVTGTVMVDRDHLGEPANIVVEDERALDGLSRWADAARSGGSRLWMQINHPGRNANALATRTRPVAPSAIKLKVPGMTTPRALPHAEIEQIIDRYVTAAVIAEKAGFDGAQIHGAHGYLISQFLSPLSNQRDDEWGGDLERRMRFGLEIVRRVRSAVSKEFAVGIKLNSADFQRGGFTPEESREVMSVLAREGLDLIEISGGTYEAPAMMGGESNGKVKAASTLAREAYFLEYAEAARSLVGDVPLAVTGGFRSHAAMADAVASDTCQVIGLGRPTCTTPAAPKEVLASEHARLECAPVEIGLRRFFGRFADLKMLDGAIELQWYADQMHRLADSKQPDLDRQWWRTAGTMIRHNGIGALRHKRG